MMAPSLAGPPCFPWWRTCGMCHMVLQPSTAGCCIGTTTQHRVLSCAYAQDRTRLQVAHDRHAGDDGVPFQLLHVQTKVDIFNHELCNPTFFSFSRSHTCRWQMTVVPAGMACPSSSSCADMSLAGSVSTDKLFMLTRASSFVGFHPVRTHLQVADDGRAGRDGVALQLVVRRQVAHHHRHHRILPQRLLQMMRWQLGVFALQSPSALVNRPAGCQQTRQSSRQQLREGR